MSIRASLISAFVLFCCSLSSPAIAHPHNWIDLWVEVQFDKDGEAIGLNQKWLFDDIYSVTITEGMDGDGDGKPDRQQLDELLKTVLTNLKKHKFFTHVEQGSKSIPTGPVSQGGMAMLGHRLEFSFYIPFNAPINPRTTPLSYRIFDPGYYIEMLHAEVKDAIVLRNVPTGCMHSVEAPNPDPKKVAYAASLPAGVDAGNELGKFFAEKVIIKCQNKP
jgi:ABC-type uncharacterized transport system substrate-binding protein